MPEDQPLLNEHQRRHFEVLLAGLDDTLASIEEPAARTDRVEAAGLTRYEPDR